MIVVDASVWIAFFRGHAQIVPTLGALLDRDEVVLPVPVRVELLSGARRAERPRLQRLLSALPVLYASQDSWRTIETWVVDGAAKGHRFGVGDLLIAVLAFEQGHTVWSLDADFVRMARLGMVTLAKF